MNRVLVFVASLSTLLFCNKLESLVFGSGDAGVEQRTPAIARSKRFRATWIPARVNNML